MTHDAQNNKVQYLKIPIIKQSKGKSTDQTSLKDKCKGQEVKSPYSGGRRSSGQLVHTVTVNK